MKECFKCKETKSLSEFYKHKQMTDGHLNKCKECAKLDSRNNEKNTSKSELSYDKTESGVIRVIYKSQVFHSKKRGNAYCIRSSFSCSRSNCTSNLLGRFASVCGI